MITKGSKLPKGNIPGLTYHPDQAPSGCRDHPNNKKWNHVLRAPTKKLQLPFLFKIEIRDPVAGNKSGKLISVILVQFLPDEGVPPTVRHASSFFLNHHSSVRETPHESGRMVAIGLRFDPRSARHVNYQASSKKRKLDPQFVLTERQKNLSLLDFNQLFYKSSEWFNRSLSSSINKLKDNNHILEVQCGRNMFSLLPTYMCSSSLHNSVHRDSSDFTASFSIFYQEQCNKGLSYLVFPDIGLAVELRKPVLVR